MNTEQRFLIIDGIMGVGKTTEAIKQIKKETKRRTIVVLPYNDEVDRYAREITKEIGDEINMVPLGDKFNDTASNETKTFRFTEALKYADCIVITHALFERLLSEDILSLIEDGDWHGLIDETVNVFEEQKGLDKKDIQGFIEDGIASVEPVGDGVSKLILNHMAYNDYLSLDRTEIKRRIIKCLKTRDFFILDTDGAKDFYSFSMSPQWINAFKSVTVMTYLFKNSDLDYWLQIYGYNVEHLEITRAGEGHTTAVHSGYYSGKDFRHLIKVEAPRGRGEKYGDGHNDLSCNQLRKMSSNAPAMVQMKQTLRSFKERHKIANDDFLFTCRAANSNDFIDRKRKLQKSFVGAKNFEAFNVRGKNKWDARHYVYYCINVFPFPAIEKTIQRHGLTYDRDHFALSTMLQFIWRSAIRKGEPITILIQSKRMRDLFIGWLNA